MGVLKQNPSGRRGPGAQMAENRAGPMNLCLPGEKRLNLTVP